MKQAKKPKRRGKRINIIHDLFKEKTDKDRENFLVDDEKELKIKEYKYHETIINLIRTRHFEILDDIMIACKRMDQERTGLIMITSFVEILGRFVPSLNEE